MDYASVVKELREELPSAARVVEIAVELLRSQELSWELVVVIAVIAGRARDELMGAGAQLDGMLTRMAEKRKQPVVDG